MIGLFALGVIGCTRSYYHDYADRDVYGILKERLLDWRWRIPERPVEAPPASRMADVTDPNHTPIVPDEIAARRFQVSSRFPFEYHGWKKRGTTPIEDLRWQQSVQVEPDGKVLLSRDSIMRLAMTNSREYQFQYEDVYLSALSLTLARFQFMIQGYSNWGASYVPMAGAGFVPTITTAVTSSGSTSGVTSTATSTSTSTSGVTSGSSSTSGVSTGGTSTTPSSTSGSTAGATTAARAFAATPTSSTPNLNNQLQTFASNGFSLNLMSGAQMLVNLANSLVFEFSNHGVQLASPNLTISFIQPFLRGAWARVVTQALSLQERQTLYALRSFAEYRRGFYTGLITGAGSTSTGYLDLVSSLQAIRNAQANLISYKQNLDMYEAELRSGFRTVLERDQLALNYQTTQATLLTQQAALQTSLDSFKISLGVPPELEVRLDDSVLDPFQLNDDRLNQLRERIKDMLLGLYQTEIPDRALLRSAANDLVQAYGELEGVHDQLLAELKRWRDRLEATRKGGFTGPDVAHDREVFSREDLLSRQIQDSLIDTDASIDDNQDALATYLAKLDTLPIEDAIKQLREELISKQFRARLSEVFVSQTQTRVFLIELKPVDLTVDQAIQVALGNRLDLQNALAQVTDAWRQVEVDANALQGILNFVYTGSFNSAPGHATLFRFDASSSVQSLGLEFDAPINRRAERNQYRADQIQYQRARRAYMQARDTVVQEIRLDTRQLTLARRTFEINREQIISASRLLEEAEYALQKPLDSTAPVTLNLLNALNGLLSARNSLITSWVAYETARYSLYRDFDLMDIDGNGTWTNENDPTAIVIALRNAERAPAYNLGIPARFPDLSPGRGSDSIFYTDVEPGGRPGVVPERLEETEGPLRPDQLDGATPAPRPAPPPAPSPFAPGRP